VRNPSKLLPVATELAETKDADTVEADCQSFTDLMNGVPFAYGGGRRLDPCSSYPHHLLHPHSSQLTAHSSQLTAHSSQLTAHSSQLTAHSSQLTAHSSQLIAHRSPLTAHSSPLTAHSSSLTASSPRQVRPSACCPYCRNCLRRQMIMAFSSWVSL
jgi:hypothetical protein